MFSMANTARPFAIADATELSLMLGRPKLVLASGSPRRVGLINQAGIEPDALRPADLDETPLTGELPRVCANRMAYAKATTALAGIVVDTEVYGRVIMA